MRLLSTTRYGRFEIGRAPYSLQREGSGDINSNLQLSSLVTPGNYSIEISQTRFQLPFFLPIGSSTCFPFLWNLLLVPNVNAPYIPSVSPPAGIYLSPQAPLELDFTFSTNVFAGGSLVTNAVPFSRAFYLYPIDDLNTKIYASMASQEASNSYMWHITFPPQFVTKKTYKLGFVSGILTNQNGDAIQLVSIHTFTMIDTTCNERGTFDSGYCFCARGYGGDECTTCAAGFVNTNTTGGLACVKQTGRFCLEDSCGCVPNKSPCVPIGTCDDSSGQIKCSCPSNYGGSYCDQCATGYTDYTRECVKSSCPVCVHGACDTNSQKCICNGHFGGADCSDCANGWSGSDCTQQVPNGRSSNGGDIVQSSALTAITVICIIVAITVLIGTVGLLLYKKFFSPRKYSQLELSEIEE